MIFSWILERDAKLYARASSTYNGHLEERKRQEMTSKDDHIERTKRMIEVMQAYVDGEEIEFKSNSIGVWKKTKNPGWYWNEWNYRIADKGKDMENRILNSCPDCSSLTMEVLEDGTFVCKNCNILWSVKYKRFI